MIAIDLIESEIKYGREVAQVRFKESRRLAVKDRRYETVRTEDDEPDVTGCLVELAAKKYLNMPLELSVNEFREADIPPDIEVRGSRRGDARLLVRKKDEARGKLDRKFILGIVTNLRNDLTPVYLMGWAYGTDAVQKKYWANPNGKEWAWFMPVSDLTPISYLPTHKIELDENYYAWAERKRKEHQL